LAGRFYLLEKERGYMAKEFYVPVRIDRETLESLERLKGDKKTRSDVIRELIHQAAAQPFTDNKPVTDPRQRVGMNA
jgi:hypothetical protein